MIATEESSASFKARSAPRSFPTGYAQSRQASPNQTAAASKCADLTRDASGTGLVGTHRMEGQHAASYEHATKRQMDIKRAKRTGTAVLLASPRDRHGMDTGGYRQIRKGCDVRWMDRLNGGRIARIFKVRHCAGAGRCAKTLPGGAPLSYFQTYADRNFDYQRPADVAVIISSVMRPTLADALKSVFRQDRTLRIQVLIGVDKPTADSGIIEAICAHRPPHCCVNVLYPGYSTSTRHGGLHPACDGGVLRCILTYLANSRYVAFLDDDNWWADNHLSALLVAIQEHHWAYSLRWFVDPKTRRPICVDKWESVGPGRGVFARSFGGWVDANCLMFDKLACDMVIPWWTRPIAWDPSAMTADRQVFACLKQYFRGRTTGQPTVFYQINPSDDEHANRVRRISAVAGAKDSGQ
jgi:hypothetical protein